MPGSALSRGLRVDAGRRHSALPITVKAWMAPDGAIPGGSAPFRRQWS